MTDITAGVITATFNGDITGPLADGARAALDQAGVTDVINVEVAGALEIPVVALAMADKCDIIVVSGAVIEGETDHYKYVCEQTLNGLTHVSMTTGVPIGNAVLTVREYEHARERSMPGPGNKGAEAAEAALIALSAVRSVQSH